MDSILQPDRDRCYLCGRNGAADPLDEHHVFGGPNRKLSERYGLTVILCHHDCHIYGPCAAHNHAGNDLAIKQHAQREAMTYYGWNTAQFVSVFGKNYLDEWED